MTISNSKPSLFGREPALILGAVNSVIAVAVGFGLNVTPEQVGLINAATAAVLAVIVRAQVTPVAEVAERVEGGKVVAGPANDVVPAGAVVRDLGEAPAATVATGGGAAGYVGEHRPETTYSGDSKTDATYHG